MGSTLIAGLAWLLLGQISPPPAGSAPSSRRRKSTASPPASQPLAPPAMNQPLDGGAAPAPPARRLRRAVARARGAQPAAPPRRAIPRAWCGPASRWPATGRRSSYRPPARSPSRSSTAAAGRAPKLSVFLRNCRIHLKNNARRIDTRFFATPVEEVVGPAAPQGRRADGRRWKAPATPDRAHRARARRHPLPGAVASRPASAQAPAAAAAHRRARRRSAVDPVTTATAGGVTSRQMNGHAEDWLAASVAGGAARPLAGLLGRRLHPQPDRHRLRCRRAQRLGRQLPRPGRSADAAAATAIGDGSQGDGGRRACAPATSHHHRADRRRRRRVAPALLKFTPEVEVRVESPAGQAGRHPGRRHRRGAAICPSGPRPRVGKLNQVGLDAVPESNVLVYRFADTPIDLAGGGQRQLRAGGHRHDQRRRRGPGHRAVPDRRRPQPSASTRPWQGQVLPRLGPDRRHHQRRLLRAGQRRADEGRPEHRHLRRPRAAPAASSTPPPWTSPASCPPWRASRS